MQRVVSKSMWKSVLASIFAMAFVVSVASAKFPGRSNEKSATVDILTSTQVPNGPTLRPGSYQVKVLNESGRAQVGFYQNSKLVGQAAATLVDDGHKNAGTAAHFSNVNGNQVLTGIDVNGWTKSIQFGTSGSGATESGQ